jgi:hypothetical protein
MAEVESLLVAISADTSNLVKGLRDGEGVLARFGRIADNISLGMRAFLGAAVVQQLSSFSHATIHSVAQIGKLADQVGLTTQQFQQFALAADRSGQSNEQVAGSIAEFSRNLSDLQRGSGRFLQFLRESAPALVSQFQAAEDANSALLVLADAMSTLGSRHDQLRLAQAAGVGGMQGFVNALSRGRGAFTDAAVAGNAFTDEAVANARRIEDRYNELFNRFTRWRQGLVVGAADALAAPSEIQQIEKRIQSLEDDLAARLRQGRAIETVTRQIEAQRLALIALRLAADDVGSQPNPPAPPPPSEWQLQQSAIKAAQGELSLYMQRLQAMPPLTTAVSTAFGAAWEKQLALLRLQGATEAEISAARIAMIRQEDAERMRVLGNSIQPYDEMIRRQNDLNHALADGIITAEQHGRAMVMASAAGRDAYLSATSAIGQAVARVFEGNKGVAIAAAIIDTLAAANKALAAPPGPPVSYAYVAAALAAGFANVRQIMSTTKNSTSTSAGGGGAPTAPAVASQQSLHVTGVDPAMIYSGTQFESFIGRLNDVTKNGGTLLSSGSVPT